MTRTVDWDEQPLHLDLDIGKVLCGASMADARSHRPWSTNDAIAVTCDDCLAKMEAAYLDAERRALKGC